MSGGLLPQTVAILRLVKPAAPLFSNMVIAEAFEVRTRRPPYRVYRRTDGRFAVVDERRAMGDRTVEVFPSEAAAVMYLDRIAPVRAA